MKEQDKEEHYGFREFLWFSICLCLFLILGPFSLFVVIYGLCILSKDKKNMLEPDKQDN